MRTFYTKLFIATLLAFACHALVLLLIEDRRDPYYLKVANPVQNALIIGTSRASQGIDPAAVLTVLGPSGPHRMLNFAFSAMHSPFGPTYLRAITQKVRSQTHHGFFLITVDPWALSTPTDQRKTSYNHFREDKLFLGNMFQMNGCPNIEYFVRSYPFGWGSMLGGPLQENESSSIVLPNGLVVITAAMDSTIIAEKTRNKLAEYQRYADGSMRYDVEREMYLVRTIEFLKERGKVFLVRVPIHPAFADLEHSYRPSFTKDMDQIANEQDVPWLDHSTWGDTLTFTDGNHLTSASAKVYSYRLGKELVLIEGDRN